MSFAGGDWRIEAFNQYQTMEIAWEKHDAELMQGFEPKLADFYAIWLPFNETLRKMKRYSFLKSLRTNPELIDWSDYSRWSSGTESTDEEINLANIDPEFKRLRDEMLSYKYAWKKAKQLTKLRNNIYEAHRDVIDKEDDLYMKRIQKLQHEIDLKRANQSAADGLR